MTDIKYCKGCGAPIQHDDPKNPGYIPSSAKEREDVICRRCFRIKHYNEIMPVKIDENDFLQILNRISESDSIVIQIVDLFDIDGTLIHGLHRFIGKNPFILVANKIDIFPKSLNAEKIKQWLYTYVKEHGLHPKDIFLISAEKGTGVEEIANYINRNKHYDVHVVGATNVGKSSFINRIIKLLKESSDEITLTTSRFPGTTLDSVKIPISKNHYIIDTPGVVHKYRFSEMVMPETLKIIIPNKIIKPKIFQLNGQQTLFFGGLARIDQAANTRNSFVCYLSNEMFIHRTKMERAEEIYRDHLGELLSPPSIEEAKTFPAFSKYSFKITGKTDIVISGLGWIAISGEDTIVDVYVPKGIGVHARKSLI